MVAPIFLRWRTPTKGDVITDGYVIARVEKAYVSPVGRPWKWTFAHGTRQQQGFEADQQAAFEAVKKRWMQENGSAD
jgi:hypothetical protein